VVEINAHRFPYYVFARQPRQPWQPPLKSFDINMLPVAKFCNPLATLATRSHNALLRLPGVAMAWQPLATDKTLISLVVAKLPKLPAFLNLG
jgi:hypothetical protein